MFIWLDHYSPAAVSGANLSNFSGNPYGTPALHLRLRPSSSQSSLLQYGGGIDGEVERFVDVVHRIGLEPFKEAVYANAD